MPNILMIYVEPTPYIVGLIKALESVWQGKIDVLFLGQNTSQNWSIPLDPRWKILSGNMRIKVKTILNLILKNKYKNIHIAGWASFLLLMTIAIAKFARIPISVESDSQIPQEISLWKRFVKRLIYPLLFRFIDLFLPGGTRQAKYFEYYGVEAKRIIPVQMTVDITGIKRYADTLTYEDYQRIRSKYHISEDSLIFLFVGRFIECKGITDLISAFNGIQYPNVKLLIVGDGPLRSQVEKASRNNKQIIYAGQVLGNELIEIYYVADTLVLPSYRDAWGLVVNEAMSLGLPVIVSDRVGCIEDLVLHQGTGLVVKAGNVAELKSAMEQIAHSKSDRLLMANRSAQKMKDWTLENEAKKICQAWNQLVSL